MTDTPLPSFFEPVDLTFPPAERIGAQTQLYFSPEQSLYALHVTFIGQRPTNVEIDRVLRECTALAAAHDARFDIHAQAEVLLSSATDPDAYQTLNIHGQAHFLCFDCKTGVIGLRRIPGALGESPDPCLLDGDGSGGHGAEGLGDATENMLVSVTGAIGYGFDSPAEIEAMIDKEAGEGTGVNIQQVKACAAETLAKKRRAEAQWPQTTDCDRLDRAFARLHDQGILALQCAGNTLSDGVACVNERLADERVEEGQYTGFCFFHTQDIDHALQGEGLFLAFGPIDSVEDEDEIAIGHTICEALREAGLEPDWDGRGAVRIGLPRFSWQRRTPD